MNQSVTSTPTSSEELDDILARAAAAADAWAQTSRADRAVVLEAIADRLDHARDELVQIAHAETHLAHARLRAELQRTTFQLRLFGDEIRDGSYLGIRIDHADPDWPMGAPRPELRRMLVPLGPTVVFAASNFPFAFSVAGGDTAAALAAGCPVILKAHSGHPDLSRRTGALVSEAVRDAGGAPGVFAVIFGTDAGRAAVQDPRVKAGAFTGSLTGGRALFDLANARPDPIPFYGELGSVNPVFVTEAAAASRASEIAAQFAASMTLSAGQFCTKPGLLVVPERSSIVRELTLAELPPPARLLNERIQRGYVDELQSLRNDPAVTVLAEGADPLADPPGATLLRADVDAVIARPDELVRECFGPTALVVTYRDETRMLDLARIVPGQLTATVVAEGSESLLPELLRLLAGTAGRVLWNQWPTGVSVTHAQQHGGPYPASTSAGTTSVGTASISRFLRPVAYQGFPLQLLPEELRDQPPWQSARLVDGLCESAGQR
ncbi:aldehyde dehydrogenase (NADP(+)) [Microbacterium sp. SSM24]|uniref:aldehyde dehydrogenase (NADP(+)) n=1 Tax=Microbacterium sp. SSM24 TaxID=2991714 RepID=UPI002225F7EA|nr:aldehyde dehydrogenase (NADP(+)) [Microbacterium sp. SSM24]MCW3492590.1 aldehyde dehydrogenase (NADP(+)) [Microbacterium sp. SSM24]